MTLKTKLFDLVSEFRKWRSANYSDDQIAENSCDDPSFPGWQKIETLFEEAIKPLNFSTLDRDDLENLLYLVARNWDIGSLLSWHTDALPFHSSQDDLKDDDFLVLAKVATELQGDEFVDAKSVMAACFRKLDSLSSNAEKILLKLYHQDDEYTKRQALFSLAKLRYSDITSLLKKSWTIQDQWHKMGCLHVIQTYLRDEALLLSYINKVTNEDGQELFDYAEKVKSENNYR